MEYRIYTYGFFNMSIKRKTVVIIEIHEQKNVKDNKRAIINFSYKSSAMCFPLMMSSTSNSPHLSYSSTLEVVFDNVLLQNMKYIGLCHE